MLEPIRHNLSQLEHQGQLRHLFLSQGVDVSSNDTLALSTHPQIRCDLVAALEAGVPMGSGGSRLLHGHHRQHEEMECFLADKFECEAALIYGSGYLANLGVITSLFKDFHIFSDELNHASLIDGIRLSGAKKSIYKHCDLGDLREQILASSASRRVIVTESLFSMNGDFAPIDALYELAQGCGAWLLVDEAHATGIYGQRGLGLLCHRKDTISVHTMGKALGSQGAFVLCPREVKEWLVNTSRSFIYTTSPSPLLMEQWKSAWGVWESEPQRREKLLEHMQWFYEKIYRAKPSWFQRLPSLRTPSLRAEGFL